MIRKAIRLGCLSCAVAPVAAQDISLRPPLDCGPATDQSCIIQYYVDRDPSPAAQDFLCGPLTYNGHKGTDFRLATLADMAAGVPVFAAASGRVSGIRDDMPDRSVASLNDPSIKGRECGNGLVIDHGGGWQTQYCHLKQSSLRVQVGDLVQKGGVVGQVGLSGATNFPHVHFSVRKDGHIIDPFDPEQTADCAPSETPIWDQDNTPRVSRGGILETGFYPKVPKFDHIRAGTASATTLPSDAEALVLWSYIFGGQEGDVITFDIRGPEGWTFTHETTLERTQAELFRAGGKRRPARGWIPGLYQGQVAHHRNGLTLSEGHVELQIVR